MYGFSALTWNSGQSEGTYSKALGRILYGGSPGHGASKLVIPLTEENRILIQEVNEGGNLLVKERTTRVVKQIDTEPYYQEVEEPCFEIYFSFWGDPKTKPSREKHRLVDENTDRIEEGMGIPIQPDPLSQEIFKAEYGELESMTWSGLIGSTKGFQALPYKQDKTGLSHEQIQLSQEQLQKIKLLEREKDLVLLHVKTISAELQECKTDEEKEAYLQSEDVQFKLENDEVESFDELKTKLKTISAGIKQIRSEVEELGVRFGSDPDNVVMFPIDPDGSPTSQLDYKGILKEMGRIANGPVPYHAYSKNCCTVTMEIIKGGLNDELKSKMKSSGYSIPSSNTFLETPQSVFEFSNNLFVILEKINKGERKLGAFAGFQRTITNLFSQLFPPNPVQELKNQIEEYHSYIEKLENQIVILDKNFEGNNISEQDYQQTKRELNEVIVSFENIIKNNVLKLAQHEVNDFIKSTPYAKYETLKSLKSHAEITEAIRKIASDVYSSEIRDDRITNSDIEKIVAQKVESIVNTGRLEVEKYNYRSYCAYNVIDKLSVTTLELLDNKFDPEVIHVSIETAKVFRSFYQDKHDRLSRSNVALEKRIQRMDSSSRQYQLLSKNVADNKIEIEKYNQILHEIDNSESPSIEIEFPPFEAYKSIAPDTLKQFLSLYNSSDNKNFLAGEVGSQIAKTARHVSVLEKKLLQEVNEISPSHIDHGKLASIIKEFKSTGNAGKESSVKIADSLCESIINSLKSRPFKVPLSQESRTDAIAYLNIRKALVEELNFSSETSDALNIFLSVDPDKVRKAIDDSDKFVRYYQISNKDQRPSSISKNITHQQHQFINLYDKIIIRGNESSHQERYLLYMMIENSIGDMNLNRQLDKFSKENHPLLEQYEDAIHKIKYFSFKASLASLNDTLLNKTSKLMDKIENNEPIDSKLNMYEIGRLDDLAKLKPELDKFNALGLIEHSSKLKKLYSQATKAAGLIEKIEVKISKENNICSGDILMSHSKKSLAMKNKSADREVALTHTFISKYGHAAQIYINSETNNPSLSHIWGSHELDRVKAVDYATSDIFRVDVSKLLPEDVRSKLESYYNQQGLDYKEEIQKIFMESMQDLHMESHEKFENVKNDKNARFQAGLADYGFYGGHSDNSSSDRQQIHSEMYGKDEVEIKSKTICSEFVAKSIIASLIETSDKLRDALEESNLLSEGETIIKLPFESEKFERIHPERLVRKLQEVDCVSRVSVSSYLDKLVGQDNLSKTMVDKNIKSSAMILHDEIKELGKINSPLSKTDFVSSCYDAFEKYSKSEHLDIKFESPRVKFYLNDKFTQLHSEINSKPNCILNFFKSIATFFGYTSKAKKILTSAVKEIEKVDNLAIRDQLEDVQRHIDTIRAYKDTLHNIVEPEHSEELDQSDIRETAPK